MIAKRLECSPEPPVGTIRIDGVVLTERMTREQHERVNPAFWRLLASIRVPRTRSQDIEVQVPATR